MSDTPRRYASPWGILTSFPLLAIVALSSLSSFASSSSSLSSSNTDLQTLLCLKIHLSSNPDSPLGSWTQKNSSLHFCSWPGVTCSKARVVALGLESSSLHGHIPPCIVNLTLLARIHLPNNQLAGHIPPEIGRLSRLSYLNLSSNGLTDSIPATLSSSTSLHVIDLAGNSLTGSIPVSLGSSSSLVSVLLANRLFHRLLLTAHRFRCTIPL
ncbi:hypothetical protein ACP4OV_003731 [Aristida adscensionis]